MKKLTPWWVKILAKIVLSRLPLSYRTWRKLNLFVHGSMHDPAYAVNVFIKHFQRAKLRELATRPFVAMELGPGDSLISAVVARAAGASSVYLVDTAPFAAPDIGPYLAAADHLQKLGLIPPDLRGAKTVNDILALCNATYLTAGLQSFRSVPSKSVDFVWSHAVLVHIRRHEFLPLMQELRRVLRQGAVCSHRVDLKDHLGGALNNLRFPSGMWEAEWMARSGFYTNRFRYSEMIALFRKAGFEVEVVGTDRWQQLPTPRARLAREFQDLDNDDLLINGFDVLLRLTDHNYLAS